MKIGRNIQHFLEKEGISQNDLARRAHISQSGLSSIINDQVSPKIDTVEDIAAALNCDFVDLLQVPGPAAPEFTPQEREIIRDFRALNHQGKEYVLQSLAMAVQLYISRESAPVSNVEAAN